MTANDLQNMEIYIDRNGEQFGPYPRDIALLYLRQGSLSATDSAWHEGLADWKTLSEVLGVKDSVAIPIRQIAAAQAKQPVAGRMAPAIHVPLAPIAAAAPRKLKQRSGVAGWLPVLLIAGGCVYYFHFGAGRELGRNWRARLAALISPAVATTPPISTAQPAAESTPAAEEPAKATAAEQPAEAVVVAPIVAPTPEAPRPLNWTAVSASPALWPKTVVLKEEAAFPAMYEGRIIGSIKVPRGTVVALTAIHGEQVTVVYQGGGTVVSAKTTDAEERLRQTAAVGAEQESAVPALGEARTRKQEEIPGLAVQPASAFNHP